jgi:hypothetical protein
MFQGKVKTEWLTKGALSPTIDRGQRCLSGANRCFLERRSVSLANYHLRDLLQSALHSEKVFEAFSM